MPFFPGIDRIQYEGPASDNPLAFRWFDAEKVVAGKPMKVHLRFACAYWHSFGNTGADPFGDGTQVFPWNEKKDALDRATDKMDAAFEFMEKLGLSYYCFHDADFIDLGTDIADNEKRLLAIAEYARKKQQAMGIQCLWGTANLFSHKRYMNGAATSPDFDVLAWAGAQVKAAIDATILLDGENYVFWGGREGYMTLLNTDMKREKHHLAIFLHKAKDYARASGFTGTFLIEPKPCEPSKHQYDYDAATVIGFLREFDLLQDFKLNIEVNHATLAGHSFTHELQVAADAGVLGSIDANRGDYQNGWDTDQFPVDIYELAEAMFFILQAGGLGSGGINFDAKRRRNSTDPKDIFYAHIGSMDLFARALVIADKIIVHGELDSFRKARYASFETGDGKLFAAGKLSLEKMRTHAIATGEPQAKSGRQEYLENLINRFI